MKLLVFDTATEVCSVALLCDGERLEKHAHIPLRQAEFVLPMIDELMSKAGLRPSQLDALAFGRGPGSFTGLRLAAGVAQGIALAADLPVIPVSTLAIIAQTAFRLHREASVLATIDARMQEIYWGEFASNAAGLMMPIEKEYVSAASVVSVQSSGVFGAGSGFRVCAAELSAHMAPHLKAYDEAVWPHAVDLLQLAEYGFSAGWQVTAAEAVPVYIRNNVAHKKMPGLHQE